MIFTIRLKQYDENERENKFIFIGLKGINS